MADLLSPADFKFVRRRVEALEDALSKAVYHQDRMLVDDLDYLRSAEFEEGVKAVSDLRKTGWMK